MTTATATLRLPRLGSTDEFLWVGFECFLAAWSAEIIVFALVDCLVLCSFLVYIHIAN